MGRSKAEVQTKAVFLRLPIATVDSIAYWANKKGYKNKQAYIEAIIEEDIKSSKESEPMLFDSIIEVFKPRK